MPAHGEQIGPRPSSFLPGEEVRTARAERPATEVADAAPEVLTHSSQILGLNTLYRLGIAFDLERDNTGVVKNADSTLAISKKTRIYSPCAPLLGYKGATDVNGRYVIRFWDNSARGEDSLSTCMDRCRVEGCAKETLGDHKGKNHSLLIEDESAWKIGVLREDKGVDNLTGYFVLSELDKQNAFDANNVADCLGRNTNDVMASLEELMVREQSLYNLADRQRVDKKTLDKVLKEITAQRSKLLDLQVLQLTKRLNEEAKTPEDIQAIKEELDQIVAKNSQDYKKLGGAADAYGKLYGQISGAYLRGAYRMSEEEYDEARHLAKEAAEAADSKKHSRVEFDRPN